MVTSAVDIASRIDPEYRAVFEALPPGMLDASDLAGAVEGLRARAAARQAAMPPLPVPAGATSEDRFVTSADGTYQVMVRLYRPQQLPSPAPALYWVHGGGMVLGRVQMNDAYCGDLAIKLNALVASVEYRLAPEHPYPAPLEDCYSGLRWFASAAGELGVDPARIAIGGASAGGGLAAGLALLARDRGEVPVCFQLLVYPMLDDRNITPSSIAITDTRVWNRTGNLAGWNAYLAGNAGKDDVSAYAAPARATKLEGLPPAYVNVGTLDLFVDEDVAYAQALTRAGVPVELHVYPGAFHGAPSMAPGAALSRRWAADELAALDRALNGAR